MPEPRIEVRASSRDESATVRVRVGRRVVLSAEWHDLTAVRAMVSALGEAIAAVAAAPRPPARSRARHRHRPPSPPRKETP